jgi:hypothetical protein
VPSAHPSRYGTRSVPTTIKDGKTIKTFVQTAYVTVPEAFARLRLETGWKPVLLFGLLSKGQSPTTSRECGDREVAAWRPPQRGQPAGPGCASAPGRDTFGWPATSGDYKHHAFDRTRKVDWKSVVRCQAAPGDRLEACPTVNAPSGGGSTRWRSVLVTVVNSLRITT